ncbi:MAG: flagellar filament capping protein FliD [Methylotenera sp.]|nr:flagellar filament capping protein FliD [Oligoflexia bacterium]
MRFDPVGGGQFKEAVKQMIEAERAPIKNLEKAKAREEAKMKLFQEFKSKFTGFEKTLAEFSNIKKFRELKVDLGEGDKQVSVTFDKETAQPGSYTIEVDQLASRSSIISNGFSSPDEANLGLGYVVLNTAKDGSDEVFVDEKDSSLKGIANLINNRKDCPVHASVIQDQTDPERPWKLIVSAKNDGQSNAIEFPDFYFMDGKEDFSIGEEHEAGNALMKVDGFEIEAGGNRIKEFLEGVSMDLKQAKPDAPFTMTITEDYQKISGKVKGLVDQVNGVLDFINKQNQVDEKSDTKATFAGDSSLQSVEYRIRNVMHEGFPVFDNKEDPGTPRLIFLNQMGIEFEKNGQLSFKEEKFTKALGADFNGTAEGITGEYGIANQLKEIITGYTRSGNGLVNVRETAIRSRIKQIDSDIATKERRVEQRTQALTDQFSRLQSSLSNMQKQGQYLSATMGGGGGGGNMVQQLLGG